MGNLKRTYASIFILRHLPALSTLPLSIYQGDRLEYAIIALGGICDRSPKTSDMPDTRAQKLLFICSRNKLRSLTAEKLFEGLAQFQVRSAGTQPGARIVVTEGHIGWADLIFCMEKSHLARLRERFPEALENKRIVCLHVPDDYAFMDPDLIEELRAKLEPYVDLPE